MRSSGPCVLFGVSLAGLWAAVAPAHAQQARPAEPYPGNERAMVRCESGKGRPQYCKADVRGGARLVRQLSRSPCMEGETWGVREGEIWVKAGCRADFALGETTPVAPGPSYVKCESTSGGRRHCPATTVGGVHMIRQLSSSQCIEHSTWGVDRNSVWVSQGCRAEFQLGEVRA